MNCLPLAAVGGGLVTWFRIFLAMRLNSFSAEILVRVIFYVYLLITCPILYFENFAVDCYKLVLLLENASFLQKIKVFFQIGKNSKFAVECIWKRNIG